ncbi:hypothetical protein AS005_01065 [Thermotoga sp. KOL6]|nr:hypothetical protein AS005_01065 [Thermotoga sp. KOL6]
MSYNEIISLIEDLIERKEEKIGPEILIFIKHYRDMLRRYIVRESEIQELCRKIYQKHKKALDLIFEYKLDDLLEISRILTEMIEKDENLILDSSSKSYIRFISKNLDFIPKKGEGWTKSGRILLFEFQNFKARLSLNLIIGPGPREIREKLYDKACEKPQLFNGIAKRKLTSQWFTVYSCLFLRNYEDKNLEEIKKIIEEKFEKFKKNDLPRIEKEIKVLEVEFQDESP